MRSKPKFGPPSAQLSTVPVRARVTLVVLPAGETRSMWIETRSVRLVRHVAFPSSQTPFISPPVGLRRTRLTTLRLPR